MCFLSFFLKPFFYEFTPICSFKSTLTFGQALVPHCCNSFFSQIYSKLLAYIKGTFKFQIFENFYVRNQFLLTYFSDPHQRLEKKTVCQLFIGPAVQFFNLANQFYNWANQFLSLPVFRFSFTHRVFFPAKKKYLKNLKKTHKVFFQQLWLLKIWIKDEIGPIYHLFIPIKRNWYDDSGWLKIYCPIVSDTILA